MAEYTPSPQAVEAFKRAWHEADAEGDEGNRVSRGLAAALAQHDAELRAEVERLRAQMSALSAHAGRLEQEYDEARQQVADLRAGIGGLLREWQDVDPETWGVHPTGVSAAWAAKYAITTDLGKLLAGSGEQPDVRERCSECGPGYRVGDEGCRHRPTSAVPDSADVRERVRGAVKRAATWTEDGPEYEEAPDAGMVEEITDAVLAVVGQDVTVDDVPEQIARYVEATATDLSPSGYRAGIATAVRLIRRWRPEYAAVRPSEKGQVDDR